jgi:hypothetical protein
MTNEEIWDGWCGNASPTSEDGHFESIDDVRGYVAARISDWADEPLTSDYDDDGNEIKRYISDMTTEEIETVVNGIWNYYTDAQRWRDRNIGG